MLASPWTAILVPFLSVILYVGIGWEHQYVFAPADMQSIAVNAIAKSATLSSSNTSEISVTVDLVVEALREKYGDYIFSDPPWMLNNAGGAMGSMLVLHCSLSEYVIIFGTAVGTEGHTGRFMADDYFTILHGEQWAFQTGKFDKEVYRPGDMHLMSRGVSKQYRMPSDCWALEYARGNILSMIPFGLLDTFTSTMDLVTLHQTVYVSLKGMTFNLLKGKI